jgi:hypothetical protein
VVFDVIGDTQLIWTVVRKFKSRVPRAQVEEAKTRALPLVSFAGHSKTPDASVRGSWSRSAHSRLLTLMLASAV